MFSAGVIDQDYRGNVGVVTFNFSDQDFTVSKGDRIAQLILERIYIPELEELKVHCHFHTCVYKGTDLYKIDSFLQLAT